MTKIREYNKIVRIDIPDIIQRNGSTPSTADISVDSTRGVELFKEKLREEIEELIAAKSKDEIIEEAIDVIQTVEDYVSLYGFSKKDIEIVKESKVIKRGGYITEHKTITFLKHVEDK